MELVWQLLLICHRGNQGTCFVDYFAEFADMKVPFPEIEEFILQSAALVTLIVAVLRVVIPDIRNLFKQR